MIASSEGKQIAVAQLGARRHYAVPLALHRAGFLERFYTDFYPGTHRWGRAAKSVLEAFPVSLARRVASRDVDGLPDDLVRHFPRFAFEYRRRGKTARSQSARTANWLWGGRRFCELVAHAGLGNAAGVFAFSSAALELFEHTEPQGLLKVLDHATAPRRFEARLIEEEAEAFPGWVTADDEGDVAEEFAIRQAGERRLADVILCGSTFAKSLIAAEDGEVRKVQVVPLGLPSLHEPAPSGISQNPGLRALFVGGDGLRKGIGYLALALERLGSRTVQARAIGDLGLTAVANQQLSRTLELTGPVPRQSLAEHYRWANVLVLPSLSETFGLVILEALAFGLPVVATTSTAAPDVIEDGVHGFVIPPRSPEAIAEKLETLATQPGLRDAMSHAARQRADDFTLARYGERIVRALRDGFDSMSRDTPLMNTASPAL